jgi:pyridoxine/pyridoxamine 5'-phosphate oxidase
LSASPDNPLQRLLSDRSQAREARDPCANLCTLANIDEQGFAQARTLVLRELDAQLAVFVNTTSPKWQALCAGPVSLVVWLPSIQVQYRLNCETAEIPQHQVHDSWHLRPDAPKKMDWFYSQVAAQSTPFGDRNKLLDALNDLDLPEPLSAPATAHGVFLTPTRMERLFLGEDNGIHDRQLYQLNEADDAWSCTTLIP